MNKIYEADEAKALLEASTPPPMVTLGGWPKQDAGCCVGCGRWQPPDDHDHSDDCAADRDATAYRASRRSMNSAAPDLAASVVHYAGQLREERALRLAAEAERNSYRAQCAQLENERHAMPDLRAARQAADIARRRAELAEDDLQQVRKERDRLAAELDAARKAEALVVALEVDPHT